MKLNSKGVQGTPVFTENGMSVGKVASFDFSADTGKLTELKVSHGGFLSGLLSDELLVPWTSIREMSKERIIISDAAIPVEARALAQRGVAHPEALLKEHEA